MKSTFIFLTLMITLAAAHPIAAQSNAISTPDPSVSVAENPVSQPSTMRLSGLTAIYQDLNRCSAAALTIQLSYFGYAGTYYDAIYALNPHAEDVAVRLDEMARYAQSQGLGAIVRYGGTVDLLKALVSNGFPVLVENVYYDGVTGNPFNDFISHNRVIMGYDDALGVLYSYDSLLGNGDDGMGRPIPYEDYDNRWRAFNRDYLVLYRPDDEALLQTIMGDQWDVTLNLETSLQQSQAEIDSGDPDSFTYFNMGTTLSLLGRHTEAAGFFDQARDVGLPFRMMWYQYGPLEAYVQVGRYDDVLTLARTVITGAPGVEEMYYYAALAYEGQGDLQRAKSNLEVALLRNIYFLEASQALARVNAALGT